MISLEDEFNVHSSTHQVPFLFIRTLRLAIFINKFFYNSGIFFFMKYFYLLPLGELSFPIDLAKYSSNIVSHKKALDYLHPYKVKREIFGLDNAYEECCQETCAYGEILEYQC